MLKAEEYYYYKIFFHIWKLKKRINNKKYLGNNIDALPIYKSLGMGGHVYPTKVYPTNVYIWICVVRFDKRKPPRLSRALDEIVGIIFSTPDRIRTCDLMLRRHTLWSYWATGAYNFMWIGKSSVFNRMKTTNDKINIY